MKNAIWNNIYELRGYHTDWSKSDRKINVIWYHLYVESKKKWQKETYLQNINRLMDIENKLMDTKGERKGTIN